MGIYWNAIDIANKKIMSSPADYAVKSPNVFSYGHPLPAMIMMENIYGSDFKVFSDTGFEYEQALDNNFEDVTDEVFKKLKDTVDWIDD